MKACIVFASTSGSTQAVANLMSQAIDPGGTTTLVNLKDWDECGSIFADSYFDLVVLGTPTYGTGDWHYLWERHANGVFGRLSVGQATALYGLGDQRGHPDSFAGGLGRLHAQAARKQLKLLGSTSPARFSFRHSPALIGQRFPGLVLDYRREHRLAPALIADWVSSLLDECAHGEGHQDQEAMFLR